jgi:hypothetical protein
MRQLSAVAGVSCICLRAGLPSRAADATSFQDWQFTNADNPALPTVATNAGGVATATIVVGYVGVGWLADLSGFGTQTGLWDIGLQNTSDLTNDTRGRVLLDIPNPVPASGGIYTDFELRVVQFVDGFIYTGDLTFSYTGAVFSGRTVVESLPAPGGNWVEDQFQWHLVPSSAPVSLTITGAVGGTLLDRIRADTVTPPAPPPLVINSVVQSNQVLAVTWTGGLPPYQVYVTSNLLSRGSWLPVGPPVSGTNAEVPLDPPAGFVRVLGSSQ